MSSLDIITPVGPGHETLVQQAKASVILAARHNQGPFKTIYHRIVMDTEGAGRSAARNKAIRESDADWLFFLDADDLMVQECFEQLKAKHLKKYDGIWGMITDQSGVRSQPSNIRNLKQLKKYDPFVSLNIGCFVRTECAREVMFDEDMHCGEDFKFYLGLWERFRCVKLQKFFLLNRRGLHSGGPTSRNGVEWREAVEGLLA